MQTAKQTTPAGRGSSESNSGLGLSGAGCIEDANSRVRIDIHRKRISALILDVSKFSQNFISKSRIEQR